MTAVTEQAAADIAAMHVEIERLWPRAWYKATVLSKRPGDAKGRLRAQYKAHIALEALKVAKPDARCETCDSFITRVDRSICAADSDFYGDTIARLDGLCRKYREATK